MHYPAHFEADPDGGFTITFRDIPEAISQADSLEEAQSAALDALVTAMDFYFEDRRPVPAPSAARKGEHLVTLPASITAKVLLLNRMLAQRLRPVDLATRMNLKPQEVTRILNLHHATKIDTLAAAIKASGAELQLAIV